MAAGQACQSLNVGILQINKYLRDMFTFGYKTTFSCVFRAVLSIAVGLALIMMQNAPAALVQIIAAVLGIGALAGIIAGLVKGKSLWASLTGGGVTLLVAVLLFIYADKVAIGIFYIIAFALVFIGIMQLSAYSSILSFQGFGLFSILLSGLIVAGGIVMLVILFNNAEGILRLLSIIAGSFLVVYGLLDLINAHKIRKTITDYYGPQEKPQPVDEQ